MLVPNMEFDIMWGDEKTGHLKIENDEIVIAEQYDCELYKQFLPLKGYELNLGVLARLFESRCWERSRANIDEILAKLGLDSYNPFQIILKTRGVDFDDKMWFRFKGEENLKWVDVNPRKGLG